MSLISLLNLPLSTWEEYFQSLHLPSYRVKQIQDWIYKKKLSSFEGMLNIPAPLRKELSLYYCVTSLSLERKIESQKDIGTFKVLWKTEDSLIVESVMIPNTKGEYTICLSSQVGCSMGCSFCATGLDGLTRSLTQEEILGQYFLLSSEYSISNIVFMGMGEPFLNEATFPTLDILTAPEGFGFPDRNITVSTVGILEGIQKMMDYKQIGLALSYHSSIPETREILFSTLHLRHSLEEIVDYIIKYHQNTKKRITLEYLLLKGVNDTQEEARGLLSLFEKLYFFVNIIPFNAHGSVYQAPEKKDIQQFLGYFPKSFPIQVRFSKGQDIFAACGQLSESYRKKGLKLNTQ